MPKYVYVTNSHITYSGYLLISSTMRHVLQHMKVIHQQSWCTSMKWSGRFSTCLHASDTALSVPPKHRDSNNQLECMVPGCAPTAVLRVPLARKKRFSIGSINGD